MHQGRSGGRKFVKRGGVKVIRRTGLAYVRWIGDFGLFINTTSKNRSALCAVLFRGRAICRGLFNLALFRFDAGIFGLVG